MTVSYSSKVFTSSQGATPTAVFLRLLGRWRGSIYKLIWHDLVIYISLYFTLSCTYRFALDERGKTKFEAISLYCNNYADLIPVTFVLGFYVGLVIQRWWEQFMTIPWPDSPSVWLSNTIHGHDERGRLMRRTIVRYINLSLILVLRLISLPVKKRFPSLNHLVEAGVLTEGEMQIIDKLDQSTINHPKYWMPLIWAGSIITRARKEGRINDDFAVKSLMDKLDAYRAGCQGLVNYDWISIPLVYTQVVTLAVYSFLLSTLMGRQFLDSSKKLPGHDVDLMVPVFTLLQFFFYIGWLKVAEALINPFGEDDDDFDMNWIIDRNIQVSYLIVDEMHQEHPELVRDQFWDDIFPELPYTAAAENSRKADLTLGGAANIEIPEATSEFLPIIDETEPDEKDDEHDDDASNKCCVERKLMNTSKPRHNSSSSRPMASRTSLVSSILNKMMIGSQQSLASFRTTGTNGSGKRLIKKRSLRRGILSENRPRLSRQVSSFSAASDNPEHCHQVHDEAIIEFTQEGKNIQSKVCNRVSSIFSLSSQNTHLDEDHHHSILWEMNKADKDQKSTVGMLQNASDGIAAVEKTKAIRRKLKALQDLQREILAMLELEIEDKASLDVADVTVHNLESFGGEVHDVDFGTGVRSRQASMSIAEDEQETQQQQQQQELEEDQIVAFELIPLAENTNNHRKPPATLETSFSPEPHNATSHMPTIREENDHN